MSSNLDRRLGPAGFRPEQIDGYLMGAGLSKLAVSSLLAGEDLSDGWAGDPDEWDTPDSAEPPTDPLPDLLARVGVTEDACNLVRVRADEFAPAGVSPQDAYRLMLYGMYVALSAHDLRRDLIRGRELARERA